jgi:CRISPR-associated endonuclease/helicase Cas3
LDFPNKKLEFVKDPKSLFTAYQSPEDLLDARKYFSENIFNRYIIKWLRNDNFLIQDLSEDILQREKSCLVILNTIADTKLLYEYIREKGNVILLNTHFIPADRIAKIEQAKMFLKSSEKIILISTQLIEAGVDIDFPIVYRDLCPLPSLIQSAGRCNRNKTIDLGEVFFFQLKKEEGRPSSEIIYKKEAADFLKFCKENIFNDIEENQLFEIQSKFFDYIKNNLTIGQFDIGDNSNNNMIECVNKAEFEHLGKFQLINNEFFGQEFRYYIPENESDNKLEELYLLFSQSFDAKNYEEKKRLKIKLDNGLKRLSNRILNVRIKKNQNAPLFREGKEFFGLRILSDLNMYSSETGLNLGNENLFL